jgi:hypothetical protein
MLHVDYVLCFKLMRGGVGMPQLEVHDKHCAGGEVKPRVRTGLPSTAGHQICTALRIRVNKGHILDKDRKAVLRR